MTAWLIGAWGQIWPNLAASGITGTAGWLWARAKFRRHNQEQERRHRELLAAHQHLTERLGILNEHKEQP